MQLCKYIFTMGLNYFALCAKKSCARAKLNKKDDKKMYAIFLYFLNVQNVLTFCNFQILIIKKYILEWSKI